MASYIYAYLVFFLKLTSFQRHISHIRYQENNEVCKMQIVEWSIRYSDREVHIIRLHREKGSPNGDSGRWAIIFGHANFVDLLIARGNW